MAGIRVCALIRSTPIRQAAATATIVFTLIEMVPLLVVGHIWHSSLTISVVIYALLSTYVASFWTHLRAALKIEVALHISLCFTLLMLSKPNTGWLTLIVCAAAIWVSNAPRWTLPLVTTLALALSSLLLTTVHVSLLGVVALDLELRSRFIVPSLFVEGIFHNPSVAQGIASLFTYWLVAPLAILIVTQLARGKLTLFRDSAGLLLLGGLLVTAAGFGTDNEVKLVDTPALVTGALLLVLENWTDSRAKSQLWKTVGGLVLLAILLSATRARMQFVGPWAEDFRGYATAFHDPFFGELHSSPFFLALLQEVDSAVAARPKAKVFFGPRLEFLYARERLPSPKGLPLWWHSGTSYPESRQSELISSWKNSNFDVIFMTLDDEDLMPEPIIIDIDCRYRRLSGPTHLAVYERIF